MPKVSDYFRQSPFGSFAGRLAPDTGKDDFVQLKMHDELRRELENSLLGNPVTVRLLVSTPGGGKTWTLSWLARYFGEKKDTITLTVPRLELRGKPERRAAAAESIQL